MCDYRVMTTREMRVKYEDFTYIIYSTSLCFASFCFTLFIKLYDRVCIGCTSKYIII